MNAEIHEFNIVETGEDMAEVCRAIWHSDRVEVAIEATDANPATGKLRTLKLRTYSGRYLIDCQAFDPKPLFVPMRHVEIFGHDIEFALKFLTPLGFVPWRVSSDSTEVTSPTPLPSQSEAKAEIPAQFDARYRLPRLSKRWKSLGLFATEREASQALHEVLSKSGQRITERWVHRLDPNSPKKTRKKKARKTPN